MKTSLRRSALFVILTARILFAVPPYELQPVGDGYRLQLNLSDPLLQSETVSDVTQDGVRVNETFVRAYLYGFNFEGAEGDPALLSSDIEFALENDELRLEVTDVVTREIPIGGKLYPMQPPRSYSAEGKIPFAYNPASYEPAKTLAKRVPAPYASVTHVYTYRGQKSITVTIRPMSYDAATNTVTVVKQMTVAVKMDKPQVLHSWNSEAFDRVMRATYANLAYAAPEPFAAREKYLILALPIYKDAAELKKFVDYRSRLYDVKVVGTDEVGGTTIDAFRTFIRNEKPAFCLLVGNQPTFPSWNKTGWKSFNYYVASQVSSSAKKPQPDISLGLFYVTNTAQIAAVVNKTISTEEGLATRPKVVLGQGGNNEKMGNLPKDHCDKVVAEVVSRYFPSNSGWTASIYSTGVMTEGAKKAVEQFNKGCWFNLYNGHGFTTGQEFGWGTRDLASMTNTVFPFVLNCCCETGTFDRNCVAAAAVGNTHGPATMIAAHGTSYQGQHVLCQGYPDAIINKKITKNGLAYIYAVNYDSVPRCYINWAGIPSTMDRATMGWQFHHFGDPAIETMVSMPILSVTAPGKNEQVEQGKVCRIGWSSNIAGKVAINLYKGGKPVSTLSSATDAASGAYDWTPTGSDATGTDYQIRVTSVDSSALWDTSGTFSIIPEYLLAAPYYQTFDTLDSGSTVLPLKYAQSNDTGDVLDWLVWKGPTPSRPDTGPQGDKTTGNGKYLYIEASGTNSPEKKAEFATPNFNLNNGSYMLSFWTHLFSKTNTMGTLSLDVCVDGVWKNDALKVSGNQGDQWIEQKLDLMTYKGNRVGFRFCGVTGADRASDICIDDFRITGQTTGTDLLTGATSSACCDLVPAGSRILFIIPAASAVKPVKIALYNSRGQFVRCIIDGRMRPGNHLLSPGKLSKGLYIVTVKIGGLQKTFELLYEN
ncbi:MAG: hypothetical protein JW863_20490 [Chitinispirillaceae bacterium]|nr:hypothetical protein [Chitinispirillaceae bacterium]